MTYDQLRRILDRHCVSVALPYVFRDLYSDENFRAILGEDESTSRQSGPGSREKEVTVVTPSYRGRVPRRMIPGKIVVWQKNVAEPISGQWAYLQPDELWLYNHDGQTVSIFYLKRKTIRLVKIEAGIEDVRREYQEEDDDG